MIKFDFSAVKKPLTHEETGNEHNFHLFMGISCISLTVQQIVKWIRKMNFSSFLIHNNSNFYINTLEK